MLETGFETQNVRTEVTEHNKIQIEDVAYDCYSDRKAIYCSSNQYVKVWKKPTEGKWTLTSSLETHSGAIKVTWAHPKFGQLLAICSCDGTAAVWEEIVEDNPSGSDKRDTKHWVHRKNINDSRSSVTDVKFCPKSQELQLATCSTEGSIRIYEAPDTNKLSKWTLKQEIQCQLSLCCLDWSSSLSELDSPLIAVGCNATDAEAISKVLIYEYNENLRKWIKLGAINSITEPVLDVAFAPNLERSFYILGVATNKNIRILNLTPVEKQPSQSSATKLDIQTASKFEHDGFPIQRICWKIDGEVLASIGDDACVRMFNSYPGRAELCVLPYDEDEACHNAFYYSIRSGNIELVDSLNNRWPGNFYSDRLDKLDEILSRAYEELKLKNVLLTEEMEIFVENKLINLRFFSNSSGNDQNTLNNLNNIKERVRLVIENVRLLKEGAEIVDEKFLFIARFIAQNVHILKRQLKSTYARLPWEEIEFCLICFVVSNSKQQEINVFYRTALNKSKIINYLEYFAKKLEDEIDIIDDVSISKLAELPKLSREKVVAEIIHKNPEFNELYNDYQQIRDIHSLNKITDSIQLAVLADPNERTGQLIITRTLQVTGEYLKNTLESPKLSNITSELLLLSLPKNTRKLIIDLRNSLSHAYSLVKRTEIEENTDVKFFIGVQNDIKKIDNVIYDILYNKKITTIKKLLTKIANSESIDEIKEVSEILSNVVLGMEKCLEASWLQTNSYSEILYKMQVTDVDLQLSKNFRGDFKMIEYEKLKKFIEALSVNIIEKTNYENSMINNINNIMNSVGSQSDNTQTDDFFQGLAMLKSLVNHLNDMKIDQNIIKGIKFRANHTLRSMAPKIEPALLKKVAKLSIAIFESVRSRLQSDNLEEVIRLSMEISLIFDFGDIKYIEELRERINEKSNSIYKHKQRNIYYAKKEKLNNQLALKLRELKTVLNINLLSEQSVPRVRKSDKKLQAAIEMLVLDILSILGSFNNCLENNLLLLDDNTPLLIGKCLRNHLAHDNALMDIVSDPSLAIMLNANNLILADLIKTKRKVGQVVPDDPIKLMDKYSKSMMTITNQQGMFAALEGGNLNDLKNYLQKGADIRARSIYSWTALHFAARGPSLEIMQFILERHLIFNVKDIDGQSPLHVAAAHGKGNIVDFFLKEAGLYINDLNNTGMTPLHMAAQHGNKATVEVLLENKADTLIKDRGGLLPLHYAIRNNHIDVAKILLAQDANVDVNETMGGFTPLHEAAERGHIELVNFLLQKGADVTARNDNNWTSLHAVALNGHLEILNILIRKGADVNAKVTNGCTPLHYAAENGHKEIASILLKHGANVNAVNTVFNNTPLQYAARYGQGGVAKTLLDSKADANITANDGLTPLHLAVQYCSLEVVIVLLNYGVDTNVKDKNNNATPLHYVAENGHTKIANLLLDTKLEINAREIHNNFTPLHIAARKGHIDIIGLLLKKKAKVNIRDINGGTPLHAAALGGRKDIIDLLIQNKADVNIKTNDGFTPLHVAAVNGNIDDISSLIENNAVFNVGTNDGITPLHSAVAGGHKDVVNLLIKYNASFDKGGMVDEMLLNLAVRAGHREILEILIEDIKNINATPMLISAIKCNYKEIVEVLIANGANVNANGGVPLLLAVSAGYRDIVDILLKNKAEVNIKYAENATLLHLAAKRGHKGIVYRLITEGAEVDTTSLHIAAYEGHEQVVEILIEHGANVNTINNEGTSLHTAAAQGHCNVVKVLLNNGAKVNLKDSKNRTSFELAVAHGHFPVMKILRQYEKINLNDKGNDGYTILHIASQESNLDIIKYLVNEGSDINARNSFGSKPIHIAAREGYQDTVDFFISQGLNIDERGASNQTLLHYAAINGHLNVVKFLITKGADVNAKDANNSTPIHIAANFSHKDVIQILLKNGAVYNAVDKFYRTPLIVATDRNVINILSITDNLFKAVKRSSFLEVENCIKEGAVVNAKNSDIVAPLHYASWKGCGEVANILLQNKANPNAVGKNGLTPLHYAAKYSHLKIVKALLSNGAVYNAISDSGKTAFDFAEDTTITNLLKLLNKSFKCIKNGNSKVIYDLNKIQDINTVKAVMNACNEDNRTLVVAAVHSNFPKVEELKQISQGDLTTHIAVAKQLFDQSNYQKALIIFKSAFEKRKEILGPDNPGTLDVQSDIATVLYKTGAYQEALEILEEVFQKQERLLGLNNKDTLKTRSTIAAVLYRQAKIEEASNIYQEVYQKQKEILGTNHRDTLDTQFRMALVWTTLGKCEEALIIFRAAFENLKKTVGIYDPATISAQNNIALVLAHQGKHEEALKIYEDVFEKKKVILGINHADTLRTLHNIAGILFKQKKYHEAVKTQQKVLKLQNDFFGKDHPETLHTQYNLANMLFDQGKWIGALRAYRKGFHERKAVLGPNHPSVLDILIKLELLNDILKGYETGTTEILQHLQIEINTACNNGDKETIQRLLKDGIDINDKDIDGRTPLHYAVSSGHTNVVNMLLKNGADVTYVTNKGNTPLHTATANGHKAIIEVLLEHVSPDKLHDFINAKTTSGGTTSLHVAAKNGSLEIVKYLLKFGATYNIKNKDNKNPFDLSTNQVITNLLKLVEELFQDARKGNVEIISKLRALKIDEFTAVTSARDNNRNSLLEVAIANKHKNIVLFLKRAVLVEDLHTEVKIAASNGDVEAVQRLLKDGADVNNKDIDGRTLLHYAISNGQIDVVNILLKNGADVTLVTNKGNTPLHTATTNGNKGIIDILLRKVSGDKLCDFINAKTSSGGTTALHVVSKMGSFEIAKCLLKHGAIYNIKNKENRDPLSLSTDQSVTDLLNMADELFKAAKNGKIEVINKLWTGKQDEFLSAINARNNHGHTALQVALANKHKNFASKLLECLKTLGR